MKLSKREKNRIVRKAVRAAAILFPVLLLAAGGGYVYAKYLKTSVRKGTAIASGIWFRSNFAYPVTEGTDNEDMAGVLKTQAASLGADGTSYDFTVEIRNYQNILIFNNSSEAIPYEVSFWLSGAETAGDTYTVTPVYKDRAPDGTITKKPGTASAITGKTYADAVHFTHKPGSPDTASAGLPGGEALEDEYQIKINAPSGSPVSLYVLARTTQDAVLQETLKGEIVFVKGADEGEYLRSAGFSAGTDSTEEAAWLAEMEKQSLLTYKIVTGGADADTQELTLYWEPDVYQVDRFTNAYTLWIENHTSEAPEALWAKPHSGPEKIAKSSLTPSADGTQWYEGWSENVNYITMRADSYAAISIGFFRGAGFAQKNPDSIEAYHKYVHVEPGVPAGT